MSTTDLRNNTLATTGSPGGQRDIRTLLQSAKVKEQLALALPKFLTPDRMTRITVTSVNRNPKLLECTPESLLSSLMTAAQMGIEPDGRNGHLIPRWNSKKNSYECTFQSDYKGLVGLVRKDPDVEDIYAELVRENDVFELKKGLHRDLIHEIDVRKPRGEILGGYAVIRFRNGCSAFEWMSTEEIHAIRERSDSWKAHKAKGWDTPWVTDEGEMFKKTVLRRILKLANLSPDTGERVAAEVEAPTIEAVATTIERPQIAGRAEVPALEDAAPAEVVDAAPGEPEETQEVTPPAKEEKPKLTRTRKAAAVEKPAEPADNVPETNLDKVLTKLAEMGAKPDELLALAKSEKWCGDEVETIAGLGEAKLKLFLEDWESVVEGLNELKGAQA